MNAVAKPRKMVMPCLQCGTNMAVGFRPDSMGRNMYKWFCQKCNWRMGQWLSHALVDELLADNQYVPVQLPEKTYEETQWELREKEREAQRAEAREVFERAPGFGRPPVGEGCRARPWAPTSPLSASTIWPLFSVLRRDWQGKVKDGTFPLVRAVYHG
ncbi:MAG: hypothetical protein LOD91_08670 [Limnochordales bacterium]